MSHDKKRFELPSYEIGYGKPPLHGRFVKGKSGNPKGRPKKAKPSAKSMPVDPSIWNAFLKLADREINTSEGVTTTVRDGILKAQAAAALKGNTGAQEHFLTRDASYRKERAQDIQGSNDIYQNYIADYDRIVLSYQRDGKAIPDDLLHPDDIVFVDGDYVQLRGGDPVIAAQNRKVMIRFRDVLILQAEADRRAFETKHPDQSAPIFTSEYLILHANSCLPRRMQLSDATLIMKAMKAHALRKAVLAKQLSEGWKEFGVPSSKSFVTPSIRPLFAELFVDV